MEIKTYWFAIIILIVLILGSKELKSQGFQGEIVYKTTSERPENSSYSTEEFNKIFGDKDTTAILYLKDNRYKLVTLDRKTQKPKTVELFDPETNQSYGYMAGQTDMCLVSEMENSLSMPSEPNDTITVLDSQCNSIILDHGGKSKSKIYYSKDFNVDVSAMKNNPFGFLAFIYKTGALPLKVIMSSNAAVHNAVYTATDIKEKKLNDDIFEVPDFKEKMKSPF